MENKKGVYFCHKKGGKYVQTEYSPGGAGAGIPCHPECREANRLRAIYLNESNSHFEGCGKMGCAGRHVKTAYEKAERAHVMAMIES